MRWVFIQSGGQTYRCRVFPSTVSVEVRIPGSGPRVMRAEIPETWRYLRDGTAKQRKIAALAVAKLEG